eukprot:CAMPEP_0179409350 /NCGR_PEP_ID=MMETSP0799-20121207/2650_1 /TAXON_ID=46947 /ORGANISM="Geminigera cryophila, Strain CCMP2564" /LENGTH=98 /DNA_ID=CAMNT_0021181013 /DNA_START=339 /DNA_END=635 /DNA_ORIENTATION=-
MIETSPSLEISSDGTVFWSCPQQVRLNMMPQMDLKPCPFDTQTLKFSLGPWLLLEKQQNTTFISDDSRLIVVISGIDQIATNSDGSMSASDKLGEIPS